MRNHWQAWTFAAFALAFLAFDAIQGFHLTRSNWFFLLVAGGCLLVSIWTRRRGEARLPKVSDEKFLLRLAEKPVVGELLLAERRHVAGVLGLNPERLDPRQKLDDLRKTVDFVGSFEVALGDLYFEAEERGASPDRIARIATVGDLIRTLAAARKHDKTP